ncbi:MAG: hypothetical protein LLG04_12980, partial [Parachlamydia sp.]|nr:hypothetical protein [Parachlamydia sp.]
PTSPSLLNFTQPGIIPADQPAKALTPLIPPTQAASKPADQMETLASVTSSSQQSPEQPASTIAAQSETRAFANSFSPQAPLQPAFTPVTQSEIEASTSPSQFPEQPDPEGVDRSAVRTTSRHSVSHIRDIFDPKRQGHKPAAPRPPPSPEAIRMYRSAGMTGTTFFGDRNEIVEPSDVYRPDEKDTNPIIWLLKGDFPRI